MAIVTQPDEKLEYYKSIRDRITLITTAEDKKIIKGYGRKRKKSLEETEAIGEIFELGKQDWANLSEEEQAIWNDEAESIYMTGVELFIQENWKMGLNAISGVGLSNFCYSNGAI